LSRQILGEQRAALGPPGVINAGGPRAIALTRLGRYQEARAQLDELVPLGRGIVSRTCAPHGGRTRARARQ
jgi:hypothetical protein